MYKYIECKKGKLVSPFRIVRVPLISKQRLDFLVTFSPKLKKFRPIPFYSGFIKELNFFKGILRKFKICE